LHFYIADLDTAFDEYVSIYGIEALEENYTFWGKIKKTFSVVNIFITIYNIVLSAKILFITLLELITNIVFSPVLAFIYPVFAFWMFIGDPGETLRLAFTEDTGNFLN
jgi:uncharacterized membrane protein